MSDTKEVEEQLLGLIDKIQNMKDVLVKSNEIHETAFMTQLYKNIEDGIFDKIQNANEDQLRMIMNYKFRYYTEFNKDKDTLQNEIKKRIREDRLKDILNGEEEK